MDTKINDPILGDWDHKYPSLMNLPLNRIYRNFNDYFSYARDNSTICRSSISGLSSIDALLVSMCHKIDKILEVSESTVSLYDSVDVNKYCEYLSYFLYDQIINNNINSYSDELYEALNKAKVIHGLNDCNIMNFKIGKKQFDKKKELYIHSEILNSIKNKHTTYNSYFSSIFTEYFNECVDSYKKITQDNYCQYIEYYKDELTTFINNFKETKNILEEKDITISAENISLLEKPTCLSEEGGKELVPEKNLVPGIDYQTVPTIVFPDSETTKMASDANTSANTGIVSGTLFGISLLSIFFLKFTPLGSRIQHKIWNTKNNYNIENKTDEIILDTSDNEDIYSYNNEYHIQYNSA
ncbi:PIR Superfamily Protein [Plasmodium ovale wallikeri]|uniref:PIR Superfamily Protein n=2 Tax=Plasmodium ovale TaxID=36330 RepID=A0A1A9AQW2_PLAOA|nr:PIR Superfamily Protein [Plasmodium ovale wallikeri]SBT59082.1 PIR Superfamily Protein [Plasmodium ovale wallikeri]SBT73126.1 hypothetical protein POWCR01_000083500 [Plasmodium ovale]